MKTGKIVLLFAFLAAFVMFIPSGSRADITYQIYPMATNGTVPNPLACPNPDDSDWAAPVNAFADDGVVATATTVPIIGPLAPCQLYSGFNFGVASGNVVNLVVRAEITVVANPGTESWVFYLVVLRPDNTICAGSGPSMATPFMGTVDTGPLFTDCGSTVAAISAGTGIKIVIEPEGTTGRDFTMDYVRFELTTDEVPPVLPPICTTGAAIFVQLAPLVVAVAVLMAVVLAFMAFKGTEGDPFSVQTRITLIVAVVILLAILAALWPSLTVC